ncbi:hypothetical protein WJX81_002534 [Elliptochloris bilobata]|uniref:SGNH hydrolase-type esterase domain-containing protein n=1 Tax=Elliptochloris bilobata TaxID=381761 RepID=A0AAW1RS06_9CHLO
MLRGCPAVVQRPEPGGGQTWGSLWRTYHETLADEVKRAQAGEGLDLVFYGDSITENWLGTSVGQPWPGGAGVAAVYQKHFGKFNSAVLAIAGDQVGNLWWRLLHGELPLADDQVLGARQGRAPRVAVILIGTNDLGASDCHRNATELLEAAPGIAQRVSAVLGVLRTALPQTHLLLQLLLPRGMDLLPFLRFKWPNRGTNALTAINARFQAMADEHAGIHVIDCGRPFVERTATGTAIMSGLMPDGLHPNAAGMELMAELFK